MSTPAGWYPDPTGRHGNRWFDGNDWTDQVADGQTVGVDPVHGGGAETAPSAGATQAVPVSPVQPGPPPGAPGSPPGAAPLGGPPPPGAPLGNYSGPTGTASGGGNKTWLIVAAVVVVLLVVGGLVVALGGGDDGDSTADSGEASDEVDQSDAPEDTVDEDPSVSDLFDDMADEGDQNDGDVFGSDEDDGSETTTPPDGEYPQEVIDTFNQSCTSAGSPASFCGCVIDELQANVPYDRFVEIDQELAANPDDIPVELTDAAAACQ